MISSRHSIDLCTKACSYFWCSLEKESICFCESSLIYGNEFFRQHRKQHFTLLESYRLDIKVKIKFAFFKVHLTVMVYKLSEAKHAKACRTKAFSLKSLISVIVTSSTHISLLWISFTGFLKENKKRENQNSFQWIQITCLKWTFHRLPINNCYYEFDHVQSVNDFFNVNAILNNNVSNDYGVCELDNNNHRSTANFMDLNIWRETGWQQFRLRFEYSSSWWKFIDAFMVKAWGGQNKHNS